MDWFNFCFWICACVGALVIGILLCILVTHIFETRAARIRTLELHDSWIRTHAKRLENLESKDYIALSNRVWDVENQIKKLEKLAPRKGALRGRR